MSDDYSSSDEIQCKFRKTLGKSNAHADKDVSGHSKIT